MNPISAFFVRNIVTVYFFYGLAFFAMGLALFLTARRSSSFRFALAIPYLAAFGILHGIHEWIEMFQKIAALTSGYTPAIWEEVLRVGILAASLLLLLAFGMLLLSPERVPLRTILGPLFVMAGVWLGSVLFVTWRYHLTATELIVIADVLARYTLGIPGAALGTWALMKQQHTFREYDMPQFGRDLVWAATALFLYGVVGQIFVRPSFLVPSNIINSTAFLQWFGIPVQLFRAAMAAGLVVYLTRAMNAFEEESRRQLAAANQARLAAQRSQIEAQRAHVKEVERLNQELQLSAHELSFLLETANLFVSPLTLASRLRAVLDKLIQSIYGSEAGLILLQEDAEVPAQIACALGFEADAAGQWRPVAEELGQQSIALGLALCRHRDGTTLEFQPDEDVGRDRCQKLSSALLLVGIPVEVQQRCIGSIVLLWHDETPTPLSPSEFNLLTGVARQMSLSLENARLYEEVQRRGEILSSLLHQAVGAQETERQRIARELHDATGQSLTAVSLGLKGVENVLEREDSAATDSVRELRRLSSLALGELRQIIADLRPSHLDDLGLVAALRWYVQQYEERRGIDTVLVVTGLPVRLPSEVETVLFRIMQEALTNIAKHADAQQVRVNLHQTITDVRLTISDDGRGFNLHHMQQRSGPQSAWGLLGMQERATLLGGTLEIDTAPGEGTRLSARIPLNPEMMSGREDTLVVSG